MRFLNATIIGAVLLATLPLTAQQPAPPKGPHVKNKQEMEALQKVQAAQQSGDPDAQLAAVNNVLENFADTDYKPMLISMAMQAAQQKNDVALVTTWTDRAIQGDPDNIEARVVLAETVARHTRENDLDKADSIKKIQTNANKALDLLKVATAAPPSLPEQQWPEIKKQLTGQAYDALGQSDALDKKYPDAITHFKEAIVADPAQSTLKARLAKAYIDNKQWDDAISTADLVMADAAAQPAVKQFAQAQKDIATKMKGVK